jgi:nucleoside-diphosphate-sugar epimerase
MVHLILTGATGLVGSAVLAALLPPAGPISRLTILSRRPVPMAERAANPAINTIIMKDYHSYPPEILSQLQGASAVIWALGISQREVSAEKYVEITKDYTMAAAEAFKDLNGDKGINFVYVSGEGATLTPGRFTPLFGKVKGETEAALLALSKTHPSFRPYSARPGAVDPARHKDVMEAGTWERKGIMLKAGDAVLMPAIRVLYKGMHSPTQELGQALVQLAIGDGKPLTGKGVDGEGRTLSNVALRRIVGL